MAKDLAKRKREHLKLCLTDKVAFRKKTSGFEAYDFVHHAATSVSLDKINLQSGFFGFNSSLPFIISCMTGGTDETNNINRKLAVAAAKLSIPLGLGSMRYALHSDEHDHILHEIRSLAPSVPLIGNIGIAQITKREGFEKLLRLVHDIRMDAIAVHFNPLQELFQQHGEPESARLDGSFEEFVRYIKIPVIAKEVGSGITAKPAKELLMAGVAGIDTAGAGGTSWSGVEFLRSRQDDEETDFFWDWGIPTSYCIKTLKKLKKKKNFLLIGSGGVNDAMTAAKALALGADFAASARSVLIALEKGGPDGVVAMFEKWGDILKKTMYLTGSHTLRDFRNRTLIRYEKYY
ncbi:MAG: type 2 isopentenyl-diphosphate Delta-isomerase [Ignavibacteriales bacterium]|nr:MAG: type 2 isopentenyl-diphosphate Delta-isomerase [Ignavibacteriales bacterium]